MRPKTLSTIYAFMLLLHNFCFSQSDSATKSKLDEIIQRVKKLEKEETQKIGTISFDSKRRYNVYQGDVVTKRILVDSISMFIQDGFILDITVYSNYKSFTNHQAPIALTRNRFSGEDNLFPLVDSEECVVVQEILSLTLIHNYIPESGQVTLKKGNNSYELNRLAGINTILDVRIYTDALGLAGGQSNGLAMTDVKFKQILHRHNICNRGFFLFQVFKSSFNIAKFDSKFKYTDSVNYSRSDFIQRSYVNAETAFNIFNGWLFEKKSSHIYYFDAGGGINLSRLSKHKDSLTTEIATPFWFLEGGINLKVSDNIGCDFYGRYLSHHMPVNAFTSDSGIQEFFKFGTEIYYNPLDDKASRFFARLAYTMPRNPSQQKYSFFQFQMGYSLLLTKLLDKK